MAITPNTASTVAKNSTQTANAQQNQAAQDNKRAVDNKGIDSPSGAERGNFKSQRASVA